MIWKRGFVAEALWDDLYTRSFYESFPDLRHFKQHDTIMAHIMGCFDPCLEDYVTSYYNSPDVQKALHVNDGRQLKNWSLCK
ncbi:serine carboxypeptidase-like protein 31 [Tanacetum coccineum]